MEEFDYIVVGAGSAGCVVAARLSESGAHRVALLEAGGEDSSFWIHTPLGYGKLHNDPKLNWLYESEPEPELENAKVFQPRGRVLGGTGSINGSVYLRGQPEDFDYWEQLGNVGWGYEDVLPFFKKAEDNEMGADRYHGVGGPLRVSDPPRHELCEAFIKAGLEAGYHTNDDFSGARHDGFGYNQLTTRRGRRGSTAAAYLRPARGRVNLKVILNALATRIVFANGEACGVEFRQGGAVRTIMASREVILCGGTFNSPQLLQISGVGPAHLLREHGVEMVADLPGVGENLQDHFGASLIYRCTRPITINDMVNNPLRRFAMGLNYILFRKGLMATNGSFVGACVRTDPSDPETEVKLKLALFARNSTGHSGGGVGTMGLYPFPSFSIHMSRQRPDSRGTVRIRSKDSAVAPEIRFNFFVSNNDRQICIAAIRLARRIMGMPALAPYVAEEIRPGPNCCSDDDLTLFCRQRARSAYHATGTCRMGVDDKAVVDPRLRVRGLRRLRVIDASVMPRIVAANPNATIIMIAEKGSAMVLEDGHARA